jgi:3-dehydroquinate dehydratase/shikimate dehydrogenase
LAALNAPASKPGLFGRDRFCGVVAAATSAQAIGQLKEALKASKPPRVLELRLDYLRSRLEITRLLGWVARQRRLPVLIATCRRRPGGGRFEGSLADEIAVLQRAVEAGCLWCDVEIETAGQIGVASLKNNLAPARLLISAHDFRRLPQNLPALVKRLETHDATAIKISAACRSLADVRRLLKLLNGRPDIVAIPMGEEMFAARILALRQGSALAYAPIGQATAPGQISFDDIDGIYRLRRRFGKSVEGIDPSTSVYGVIGDPVAHSLSPLMHNAAFAARRTNAAYLPFRVRDLRDFITAIMPLGIAGFSVTLPHKERILRYLDDCDPLAAEIGAANTVVVRAGKLYGYNTDFTGVLRAIERRLPLSSSRVLLVGAGGVARAAAFALARAGSAVNIWARRPQRARALARAVGGEAIDRAALAHESFDAIVNCTPVGMHPGGGSPLKSRELNCRLVMDLIYRPLKTELLRLAERRKIETISGVEMFIAQGVAQWELWTGEAAPEAAMRRVVLAALHKEETAKRSARPSPSQK